MNQLFLCKYRNAIYLQVPHASSSETCADPIRPFTRQPLLNLTQVWIFTSTALVLSREGRLAECNSRF